MKRITIVLLVTIMGGFIVSCPDEKTPNHSHNWGDWEVTIPPACVEKGEEKRACGGCGEIQRRDVAVNTSAHKWGVAIPATCTEDGNSTGDCELCGRPASDATIPATGHNYDNWTEISAPTVTVDGEEESICTHDSSHISKRTLYATGTLGLVYTLIDNDRAYSISSRGTVTSGEVYIPVFYRPDTDSDYLPVRRISYVNPNTDAGVFSNQTEITGINFLTPSNITNIGAATFLNCSGLTKIKIPARLISVGGNAFAYSNIIFDVTENNIFSVIDGGKGLVRNNTELVSYPTATDSIILPIGLTSIGYGAFMRCKNLVNITLPAGITIIGNEAFRECNNLVNISLPEELTSIEVMAFYACYSLTEISLPTGLNEISGWAFMGCTSLEEITLPVGLTTIRNWAFNGCTSLISVTFMGTITEANFNSNVPFPGDLRDKYLAEGGGIGTYTREAESDTWTKISQ